VPKALSRVVAVVGAAPVSVQGSHTEGIEMRMRVRTDIVS